MLKGSAVVVFLESRQTSYIHDRDNIQTMSASFQEIISVVSGSLLS